jgi:hypothetical protein
MEEMRNTYRVFVRKSEGGELGLNGSKGKGKVVPVLN